MSRKTLTMLAVISILVAGVATASDIGIEGAVRPPVGGQCEPILPILAHLVPANVQGDGIQSCDLINSSFEWTSFCADNGLACDSYDEDFFQDWTMVAVVIETISPVICENAGPVPGWEMSCVSQRHRSIRARVSKTLAGSECFCSMPPQFSALVFLVNAVARDQGNRCWAWQETHTFECLRP